MQYDFNTCEYWLLLDNGMSMSEMLIGIYELAMTAIVIKNMQERVFKLTVEWKITLEYELNTCQVIYGKF